MNYPSSPIVIATVAFLTLGVAACRPSGPRDSGDSTRPSPSAARAQPAWKVVGWEPYAGIEPFDLGVGVVYLEVTENKGVSSHADSLVLRTETDQSSAAVAAMIFTVDSVGVTRYAVAAPDSLASNLVEYGYEESGIPFDSTDASGRWVRAILGNGPDGVARTGWIDTSRPGVGKLVWAEHLVDRPIYFRVDDRAAFFATPDSTQPVPVPPGDDDAYAIYPIAARGGWLQVRVVEPSDNCNPDVVPRRTQTVWIRYLDDRGRPNVWYYPRGC